MRGQQAARGVDESDSLGGQYPQVESLTIRLSFTTPQQQILDEETNDFSPEDACDFTASCPGRCGGQGVFDFNAKMRSVLMSRQENAQAQGICAQPVFPDSKDPCGVKLFCQISARYKPE